MADSDYEQLLNLDRTLEESRLYQEAKDEAFEALLEACRAALERFEVEEEIPAPRSMLRKAIAKAEPFTGGEEA